MSQRRSLLISSGGGNPLTDSIISYWNFDGNSNDSVGGNNGTDTSITYPATGIIDDCADFTAGASSVITLADSNTLSFGNGVTDNPWSVSVWFYRISGNACDFFSKKLSTDFEYRLFLLSGDYYFRMFGSGGNSDFIQVISSVSASTSAWVNLIGTYDGSGSETGLNVYVDGVNVTDSQTQTGTYVAMNNTIATTTMGKFNNSTAFSLNGYMDEVYLFNKELTSDECEFIYDEGIAGRTLI